MFHRQKTEADATPAQTSLLKDQVQPAPQKKEKPAIEVYVKNQQTNTPPKTEKEKTMYQNQSAAQSAEDSNEGESNVARPIDIPGSPSGANGLQRPMQPPRMPAAAYPGSSNYNNSPAMSYGQPGAAKAQEGRRLVVSEGISLTGEIESCDVLIVEGTIEAALKGAKVIEVAESGMFYGTVEIEEATIAGRFEGELTVHGRLTVRSTGSITGTVSYKELAVEAGAMLDGKITPLNAKVEKKPEGSRSAQGNKKPVSRNEGSVNELPFAEKAAAGY